MTYTYTLSNLPDAANAVLTGISGKTLLFYGEMGAGKTTLIKEIAKKLGTTEVVNSPTFSLVNEYEIDQGKLYHFDFYRINDESEALDLGVEEYFYSDNWNFIEWPEKIAGLLPESKNEVYLHINNDGSRTVKIIAGE